MLCLRGVRGSVLDNALLALSLNDLGMTTLVPATRSAPPVSLTNSAVPALPTMSTVVWDPVRQRVVGIHSGAEMAATFEHGLSPEDDWVPRIAGETPGQSFSRTF